MDWTNLDRVLVLTGEGVDGSLLNTLLALRQALVPGRRDGLAHAFDVDDQTGSEGNLERISRSKVKRNGVNEQ
jgi:hypothetical protein